MKKVISVLLSAVLGALLVIYLNQPPEYSRVVAAKRETVNASCLVRKENRTGSGVLLASGYVLTAAHVVGEIEEENDRVVSIEFFGDIRRVYNGRVAYVSERSDFAFIEPINIDFKSTIMCAKVIPKIGTEVHIAGAPLGKPLLVSPGVIGESIPGLGRTVCHAVFGNSGGGVFDSSTKEVYGVLVRVEAFNAVGQFRVIVPKGDDEFVLSVGQLQLRLPIFSMSMFVPMDTIEQEMAAKNLLGMLSPPDDSWLSADDIVWLRELCKVVAQCLILMILAIWCARAYT
jgi:hypothetical protein